MKMQNPPPRHKAKPLSKGELFCLLMASRCTFLYTNARRRRPGHDTLTMQARFPDRVSLSTSLPLIQKSQLIDRNLRELASIDGFDDMTGTDIRCQLANRPNASY